MKITKKIFLVGILSFVLASLVRGQSLGETSLKLIDAIPHNQFIHQIKGRVLLNNRPLANCGVGILELNMAVLTNDQGEFVIEPVPAAKFDLLINHPRIESKIISIHLKSNFFLEIAVVEKIDSFKSQPVFRPPLTPLAANYDANQVLKNSSNNLGFSKSYLDTLPGINKTGNFIRENYTAHGNSSSHSVILLEEMPLLDYSHALGFFSSLPWQHLKSVQSSAGLNYNKGTMGQGALQAIVELPAGSGLEPQFDLEINSILLQTSSRYNIIPELSGFINIRKSFYDFFLTKDDDGKAIYLNFFDYTAKNEFLLTDKHYFKLLAHGLYNNISPSFALPLAMKKNIHQFTLLHQGFAGSLPLSSQIYFAYADRFFPQVNEAGDYVVTERDLKTYYRSELYFNLPSQSKLIASLEFGGEKISGSLDANYIYRLLNNQEILAISSTSSKDLTMKPWVRGGLEWQGQYQQDWLYQARFSYDWLDLYDEVNFSGLLSLQRRFSDLHFVELGLQHQYFRPRVAKLLAQGNHPFYKTEKQIHGEASYRIKPFSFLQWKSSLGIDYNYHLQSMNQAADINPALELFATGGTHQILSWDNSIMVDYENIYLRLVYSMADHRQKDYIAANSYRNSLGLHFQLKDENRDFTLKTKIIDSEFLFSFLFQNQFEDNKLFYFEIGLSIPFGYFTQDREISMESVVNNALYESLDLRQGISDSPVNFSLGFKVGL